MLQKIINWIFMEYQEHLFTDTVTGKAVGLYKDSRGKMWMKDSQFSLFKVEFHAD